MTAAQIVANKLPDFEGIIPYMYLDTVGIVTTAIGNALFSLADAQKLPFKNPQTLQAETPLNISKDYYRVKNMAKGMLASKYRTASSPFLTHDDCVAVCETALEGFLPGLKQLFGYWDAFPMQAQAALLEMCYGTGVGGLAKFTKLRAAIAKRDWFAAASCCAITIGGDPSPYLVRNKWVHDQFLEAANGNQVVQSNT